MLPRYFSYDYFLTSFEQVVSNLSDTVTSYEVLGRTVKNRPVYGLRIGTGKTRVLIWSQMHGNESTTTRALVQFLKQLNLKNFLQGLQLYIIPILNPDGLTAWTRFNANNIDLNRDAVDLSQPESVILRNSFESFKPHFCFNMHDQRSIYGNLNGTLPVQLSFLAPAANELRSITPSRVAAMYVINLMVNALKHKASGEIGRYSDVYNINCIGDYFQTRAVPTVLFEAGHAGGDYHREEAVDLITTALQIALGAVLNPMLLDAQEIVNLYHTIPSIAGNYVDVLVKNLETNGSKKDVAIMYLETLDDEVLYFVPIAVAFQAKDILNAHRVIDVATLPQQPTDFTINEHLVVSCPSLGVLTFH